MNKPIDPAKWSEGEVVELHAWTEVLYSVRVRADIPAFLPGQFTKIGLVINNELISRPYSFVNTPEDTILEFYFVIVPDGPLTAALVNIKPGDTIHVMKKAAGFLTLNEIPESQHLWMLSTGTAIGPFLSILKSGKAWHRFERIVLVHAVRKENELSFQKDIENIESDFENKFQYVPFVSREHTDHCMPGRIPQAIESGTLEKRTGLVLSPESSQVMICGNPAMVKDTMEILFSRGLERNRRRTPGHISVENYW